MLHGTGKQKDCNLGVSPHIHSEIIWNNNLFIFPHKQPSQTPLLVGRGYLQII